MFPLFPYLFAMKWWNQTPWSLFFECWVLSQLFPLSAFTFIKRLYNSSSLSAIRVVSSAYLRLVILLLGILIPTCDSSSPAFLMMCSAYKLNKQCDNTQPWCTPFQIWNWSVVPCPFYIESQICTTVHGSQRVGHYWAREHTHMLITFQFYPNVGKESACNVGDPVWLLGWEDPLEKG